MAQQRKTVGILTPYVSSVFLGEIVSELVRQAPQWGLDLLLIRTADWRRTYDSRLSTQICDGWILALGEYGRDLVTTLRTGGRPVVSLCREYSVDGFSNVRSDNRLGIRLALDHLWNRGHRSIGFVGNLDTSDILERFQAYREYLDERGASAPDHRIVASTDPNPSGGAQAAAQLLRLGLDCTALIVGNDQNAAGLLDELRSHQVRIPEDIAVVSYDNSTYARDPQYQLSSLDQDFPALARESLSEMRRRLDQPDLEPEHRRIVPRLVLRSSSGDPTEEVEDDVFPPDVLKNVIQSLNYGNEVSRFLSGENNLVAIDGLLKRLQQLGRITSFATVHDGKLWDSDTCPDGTPVEEFGRQLVQLQGAQTVFILPILSDDQLQYALAVTVPSHLASNRAELTLVGQELELTAVALERNATRRRLEQVVAERTKRLAQVESALVQAARFSTMRPIVIGVSHHLGTPLGNCSMLVSALKDTFETLPHTDVQKEIILRLTENVERSIRLVAHFRQVAEIQAEDSAVDFDLRVAAREAVAVYQASHSGAVALLVLPERTCRLKGPRQAFVEALSAILNNAWAYGSEATKSLRVEVWVRVEAESYVVGVQDNGPGVEPSQAEHIFDPFFTTRLATNSGLGLTLVHNVMTTLFQGSLKVTTAPGQGFCLECRLPVSAS